MDKNLNIGTTIANNLVYHEGNHDHRGKPHEQYISKWNYNFTKTIGTENNMFYKIAKFDVERDHNIQHFFRLNVFSLKALNDFDIDINFTNDINTLSVAYIHNEFFQVVYTKRQYTPNVGKDRYEIVIYVKPYKSYDQLHFMITKSINNVVGGYYVGFSYENGIHLYNWESPSDNVENAITATNKSKVFYQENTWGEITLQANTKTSINIILNTPINWNDFVSYCLIGNGHSDIMFSPPQLLDNGRKIMIELFNPTSSAKTVPPTRYIIRSEKR